MALTDNLAWYYELDEASGNAIDTHGSLDLTHTNDPGTASGVGGTGAARDFNAAVGEYFSHTDSADFSVGDEDVTFAGWLYINATGSERGILDKWDAAGSNKEFELHFNGTFNAIVFTVRDAADANDVFVLSSVTLSATTWYHCVVIHDSVNNRLRVIINDGTPTDQAHSGGVRDGTANFRLGHANINSWHGRLQGWGLWRRVLSSAEITELYNSGAYLPYSSFGSGSPVTWDVKPDSNAPYSVWGLKP